MPGEDLSAYLTEKDRAKLSGLVQVLDGKFERAHEHSDIYKKLEKMLPPEIESEAKEYTCYKCDPPITFENKQKYGGHCKGHIGGK